MTDHDHRPVPGLRKPRAADGHAVWALIRACAPLDENSLYCNLIQCDHFAATCVLAEDRGRAVGWISAHRRPDAADTLFVWQVAVHPDARGTGLGSRMLDALLAREGLAGIDKVQATITGDNEASWALFRSLAKRRGGVLSHQPHFLEDDHFHGAHATEHLVTIRLAAGMQGAA